MFKSSIMKRTIRIITAVFFSLTVMAGCSKDEPLDPGGNNTGDGFVSYVIRQGQHYCDQNSLAIITTAGMEFRVKFDSSAVYSTVDPQNQYDINKLWGFSEGFNHQYNSARIGWRWSDNALRLFGYAYNNGTRVSGEISPVSLDSANICSIFIRDSLYEFKVNDSILTLPRTATGTPATGYRLYPYFGGDETAPHEITIKIKEI